MSDTVVNATTEGGVVPELVEENSRHDGQEAANTLLRGKAWVGGDHIYAYDLIQQKHWTDPLNPSENARYVMAGVDPAFAEDDSFRNAGYTFVVAGSNFGGGGKSIEHPILGLMGAGIKAVIADSFSRLQFRNAINNGLPFLQCRGIREIVQTGDELEVDLLTGHVRNLTNGKEIDGAPIAPFVMEIANAGGLIPYIRQKIADGSVTELK